MARYHLGRELMPWQKYVAARALEIDPETGLFAYREVRLTVPRQSGKTTILFALMLHRAMQTDAFGRRQQIAYAAQTGKDARKKWIEDWVPEVEESKTLRNPRRLKIHRATGHEGFSFPRSASRFGLVASTKKAGHGGTLDLAFVDEAFAQPDDRLEQAFRPAMSTRTSPQLWIVSTAGDADSTYLRAKVDGGRMLAERGETHGVAFFEWSAPEGSDPEDPAVWRACMPALGITQTEETIRGDYLSMRDGEEGVDGFRRAYLNEWVDRRAEIVIPLPSWRACRDPESALADGARPVFALDVSPDRAWGAVALAGLRADTLPHAKVIDHHPGTEWMVDRVVELYRKHRPPFVVLDPAGPVGSLVPALEKARIRLKLMSARDMAQACGALYDATITQQWRHPGQSMLDAALTGAAKRPLGDAWALGRKHSTSDICPLVAVVGALWGLNTMRNNAPRAARA
jgi:phage terminase large subunit-like protein